VKLYLRSTIGVDRDLPLVPHFLEHYRNLGVERFLLILHARSADSIGLSNAKMTLERAGIEPAEIWITDSWNTGDNASHHRKVVSGLSPESWILSADIDEFHVYPETLPTFIKSISSEGYNCVKGHLVQRVSRDFRLRDLDPTQALGEQFPIETDFRIGNPGKIMLHRHYLLTAPGHHAIDESMAAEARTYPYELKVMHFKWYAGVDQKYTNPALMAHHSETWEFAAYDEKIRRNFHGWGRRLNVLTHSPFLRPLIGDTRKAVKHAKRLIRRLLRKPKPSVG
jgi:hypothetical protein